MIFIIKDLYYKSYERVGVVFASVPNFSDFYSEVQGNNHGLECLRLLNEIICDFDAILDDPNFAPVDKIKTVGATYMAAVGLFPNFQLPSLEVAEQSVAETAPVRTNNQTSSSILSANVDVKSREYIYDTGGVNDDDDDNYVYVDDISASKQSGDPANQRPKLASDFIAILVEFSLEMKRRLQDISKHSYNSFKLRVGINVGPVIAGVIGAGKPQFDIWGNTVNVASRMESTCELGKVQVTSEVYHLLNNYKFNGRAYKFTCRGSINVKGKGFMTTYYLNCD